MSWSQQAKYFQRPKKERTAGGGGSYPYNNAFRQEIKLTNEPQNLLFIDNAKYPQFEQGDIQMPYWERVRHTFKEVRGGKTYFRSYLCPRQYGDRTTPCLSCTKQYEEDDKRINTRRVKYFPVISLENWYVTTNAYGDKDWFLPSTPAEARRLESNGAEIVFGRKGYISLGNGHFNDLTSINDIVEAKCVNCMAEGRRGKLTPSRYKCSNCENIHHDLETTELTKQELTDFASSRVRCNVCGVVDVPAIEFDCSECNDPKKSELFDVVLPIAKRGQSPQINIVVPHDSEIIAIDHFMLPNGEKLFNGNDFNPLISPLYSGLDFAEIFEVELREDYQEKRVFG